MAANKPLKFVPATKSVASTGLASARRLAGRSAKSIIDMSKENFDQTRSTENLKNNE
jgi:hypothetical protein